MLQHSALLRRLFIAASLSLATLAVNAACLDNVVMVHGNTGSPSDWNATVSTDAHRERAGCSLHAASVKSARFPLAVCQPLARHGSGDRDA